MIPMNWWEYINWFYVVIGIMISRVTGALAQAILPERGWRTLLLDFTIYVTIWVLISLFIL